MGEEQSLRQKTAKGLFWGGLSNSLQQLLGLLFGIVLARLLSRSDYGMIGMLTIFSTIANILQESGCAYGKFFNRKAAFISREWWPDFCNYRRSLYPYPEEGSIEEAILTTLKSEGSLITRELRVACGFTGPNMRSRFDAYVTRLQMGGYIVTEDFVYPRDQHGREYGWGWSLLTTPENLFGRENCHPGRTPQESYERMVTHFRQILPGLSEKTYEKLLK